jgi:iron complex transport system permease protein
MPTQDNSNQQNQRNSRFRVLLLGLSGILFLSTILGVSLGPVSIPVNTVWSVVAYKIGFIPAGNWSAGIENIVWLIRLPRVLLAVVVGGGLAVVGVTLQALVRNPLADPYIMGISSGASVGAVLAIGVGVLASYGTLGISFAAFIGAVVAFIVVYTLANLGKRITPESLILAGIGVGYICTGITSFVTLTSSKRQLAGQVLAWTLGSLARASWFDLSLPSLTLLIITAYLVLQARSLNALILGDETASVLGINVDVFRRNVFMLVAFITGVMVAVSGSIGFIGLMVPHMVRFVVGSDHRKVLPLSLFVGSIFLVWADIIARGFHSTIDNPIELPVGVVTSILGGPFFLWLMWKTRLKRRIENL